MKTKNNNKNETPESIKKELDVLLILNKKRKTALEKMSKSLRPDKRIITKKIKL